MKYFRHQKILEIIGDQAVTTHNELLEKLKERGIVSTQATISRDVKELRLIKAMNPGGIYCYVAPPEQRQQGFPKFSFMFAEAVTGMDFALNNVVIKCVPGMAQGLCAALDTLNLPLVVGTLAGEDTILVVTKGEEESKKLILKLKEMMK